ncbi:aminoglycoside phosphotransferase family protein [Arthrobacter alpinus]|uniref:aminoglycoside phosphotransferase family protein n=1 Tax=Arthrobacter alpinus TaxID=656366 RepID=UPI00307BA046
MSINVQIPEPLQRRHRQTLEGRAWLGHVPAFLHQALEQWQLDVDLPSGALPWHGHTGIVVPVRTSGGAPAALKLAFPHDEALLEPLALSLWGGHGAVTLLDSDASLGALLMERLDQSRPLLQIPMDEAIAVWGKLLKDLSIRPDERPNGGSFHKSRPQPKGTATSSPNDGPIWLNRFRVGCSKPPWRSARRTERFLAAATMMFWSIRTSTT